MSSKAKSANKPAEGSAVRRIVKGKSLSETAFSTGCKENGVVVSRIAKGDCVR